MKTVAGLKNGFPNSSAVDAIVSMYAFTSGDFAGLTIFLRTSALVIVSGCFMAKSERNLRKKARLNPFGRRTTVVVDQSVRIFTKRTKNKKGQMPSLE